MQNIRQHIYAYLHTHIYIGSKCLFSAKKNKHAQHKDNYKEANGA